MSSEKIKLQSGAELAITLAPFEDSKNLYQALLSELKVLKVEYNTEIDVNFFKDIFCVGFSSKAVEAALWKCMSRVTYNDLKVTKDTFEVEEARQDYFDVCFEVARANIAPFTKNLYAKYESVRAKLKPNQA
jgi:hypothetical protein